MSALLDFFQSLALVKIPGWSANELIASIFKSNVQFLSFGSCIGYLLTVLCNPVMQQGGHPIHKQVDFHIYS